MPMGTTGLAASTKSREYEFRRNEAETARDRELASLLSLPVPQQDSPVLSSEF